MVVWVFILPWHQTAELEGAIILFFFCFFFKKDAKIMFYRFSFVASCSRLMSLLVSHPQMLTGLLIHPQTCLKVNSSFVSKQTIKLLAS